MKDWPLLLVFIVVILGIGWAVGYVTAPGEWYASLNKPWFNPPGRLFGPVWSILYVLIAIAGWRAWTTGESTLWLLWVIQMMLNFLWSPAFFGIQSPALALVIIAALIVTIFAFLSRAWNRDRTSAVLFLPYAAWVTFAMLLNFSIVVQN